MMNELKDIFIDPTKRTPQIDFNHFTGDLILSGRSIPENAAGFYEPVLSWVREYINNPRSTTNLRLNLEYFNTTTSVWLAKIIKTLSKISDPEKTLFIHLYFDMEDFNNMETEDIKDVLGPVVDIINTSTVSVGVKIYGIDEKDRIIKESMVLV
jgi:hypothetical protein